MIKTNWLELSQYFSNKKIKASFSIKQSINNEIHKAIDFARISGFRHELIAIPNQTHSTNVKSSNHGGEILNTDGVFTSNPIMICSIKVADCLPIFFAHRTELFFGIIHAGWRGLVNGIISESIKLIKDEKISLKSIDVFIGPSIQACCFEIGNEIVNKFNPKFIRQNINRKYHVNLQGIAKNKLEDEGILKKHIKISEDCTFCQFERYFSFRREGEKSGRMFGLIGVK
tara:strand:+ start:3626 stop:4312 length:687 start_codon:yes stop_codon:yes gene_type:complete